MNTEERRKIKELMRDMPRKNKIAENNRPARACHLGNINKEDSKFFKSIIG